MYLAPQSGAVSRGHYGRAGFGAIRPRRRLAAITPDQAAQQAMPLSTIRNTAGFTQAVYNGIEGSAAAGQFTNFNFSSCGQSSVSLKPALTAVASGIMLKIAPLTGPAAPFVALGGAVAGLFSALFGAHAAAVKKEQQVECAAVPAANDALAALDQAVQAGTITPAQGISGLQNLLAEFTSQVAAITKMSASQCNAGCIWTKTMQAIVAEKLSQYQDLQTQQAAAAASSPIGSAVSSTAGGAANIVQSVETAAASAGIPPWALAAGLALVLYKVL